MRIPRDHLARFASREMPVPPVAEPHLSPTAEAEEFRRGTDGSLELRKARVMALIRRPAVPKGDDAELILRLAMAKLLPLVDRDDRLRARQRLASIATDPDRPPLVDEINGRRPDDGAAFAERLLPQARNLRGGLAPGETGGIGGGHSGPGSIL